MDPRDLMPGELWELESVIGPHTDEAQAQAEAWARELGLVRSARAEEHLHRSRVGEFASRVQPHADEAGTALGAAWIAWGWALDDQNDADQRRLDPDAFEELMGALAEAVWGDGDRAAAAGPLGTALLDLWRRTCAISAGPQRRRLRFHVDQYLTANVWQSAYRLRSQIPSLEEFPQMRRDSSAVAITFDVMEATAGVVVPTRAFFNQVFRTLYEAVEDVICWTNDLLTVEREYASGDVFNLVPVLRRERHLSYEEGLAAARELCGRRIRECWAAIDQLPAMCDDLGLDGAERDAVEVTAAAMLRWTRGHVEWGLNAPRYVEEAAEYRRGAGTGRPPWLDDLTGGIGRREATDAPAEMVAGDPLTQGGGRARTWRPARRRRPG